MQTTLNLRTLKAIALVASNEETHFYLCGVLVECRETHVTYVATNGHALLCAREDLPAREASDPPRFIGDIIVPTSTIKSLKVKGKDAWVGDLAELGKVSDARFILGDVVFTPINGSFPDWRRVLPGKVEGIGKRQAETGVWDGVPAQFHPKHIALMGAFAAAMGFTFNDGNDSKSPAMRVHYCGAGDPHAVTFGQDAARAFGVLMPRGRGAEQIWGGAPDWAKDTDS